MHTFRGCSIQAVVIVLLAYESVLPDGIQMVARSQLFAAHAAREALEVEDFVPGLPDHVLGADALRTPVAFGAVASKEGKNSLFR